MGDCDEVWSSADEQESVQQLLAASRRVGFCLQVRWASGRRPQRLPRQMLGAESRHILKRYHFRMRQGPAPWPGTRFGQLMSVCECLGLGLYQVQ